MNLHSLILLLCSAGAAIGAPVVKLGDFELADQDAKTRSYQFPRAKVTVMTVADHKGSDQLAPWIQRIHDRYEKRIDIDGIADVSMIPKAFQGLFRDAFRQQLKRSVMLDWEGTLVKKFEYKKGVANIYVIDREGRIMARTNGEVSDDAMSALTREIDRAMKGGEK